MEKKNIEEYLKKLIEIDEKLNIDNDSDDDVSGEFVSNLTDVLLSLNEDLLDNMKKKVSQSPNLRVRFKKLTPNAVKPTYAKEGDAGLDLTASHIILNTTFQVEYGTGIAVEIPKGYVGLIFPRSSVRNYELSLSNCVGVIDSGYRGELKLTFNKNGDLDSLKYNVGDRIGQLLIIPFPPIEMVESNELSETERGENGFGHTGV